MEITERKSPNQNDRRTGVLPCMIILHYTGTKTAQEADNVYMTPDQVSPHYMIDRDGSITKYVDEEKRSWHAGFSSWDGIKDINSASIGIEIVNGGHEAGLEEFPSVQIKTLVGLIHDIRSRWTIPDHYILGHSDIAPGRKIDPGEKFPWDELYREKIGLMPEEGAGLDISVSQALKEFGYDYTDDVDLLKKEFCRHYLYKTFGYCGEEEISSALASLLSRKLTLIRK